MDENNKWYCNIIFIIDSSKSMQGAKIDTVNSAIEELVPELIDISELNSDVSIYVNALKMGDSVRWLFKDMCRVEIFRWHDIHVSGNRNMGQALQELDSKLRYGKFFNDSKKYFKPIVFFLTDGASEDNYREPLNLLKKNILFNEAIKVGVAIGSEADRDFLVELTGFEDHIVTGHTPEILKHRIVFKEFDNPDALEIKVDS